MFLFYDWPFPYMCFFAENVAYFHFNSWLSFQRLCRLLWGYHFTLKARDQDARSTTTHEYFVRIVIT